MYVKQEEEELAVMGAYSATGTVSAFTNFYPQTLLMGQWYHERHFSAEEMGGAELTESAQSYTGER